MADDTIYWTIGEVYERLIEDVSGDRKESRVERLIEVYTPWLDDVISNYNSDFYYQSRGDIREMGRGSTGTSKETPGDVSAHHSQMDGEAPFIPTHENGA